MIQVFFEVKTTIIPQKLVMDQLEYCKENSIRVNLKTTDFYHIQRIGMIIGAYLKYANPLSWEYDIIKTIRADLAQFKIRKETVYEQKYKTIGLVLYAIQPFREEYDEMLKIYKLENRKFGRYM